MRPGSHYTHRRSTHDKVPEYPQGESFPQTRHSVLTSAKSDDPATRSRAIETIAATYWKPLYKYVRLKWNLSPEDAADFTQEFFAGLLERELLDSYDASKGRLRTFLRTCADRLFMKQTRDAMRQKRAGAYTHLTLDFGEAEQELAGSIASGSPEEYFDREWVRSLFAVGLENLRARCVAANKTVHFELFERYDLTEEDPRPSYAELAGEVGLAMTDVTNYLSFARREFQRCVLDQLREMTATEEEFRREAQALLGVDVR